MTGNRVSGVPIVRRKSTPVPLPGFEAVTNDLGVAIRAEQMKELRLAAVTCARLAKVMRNSDTDLWRAADRLERAINVIPATS